MFSSWARRLAAVIALIVLGGALSGCIVEERGGGHGHYCYWHPYRC